MERRNRFATVAYTLSLLLLVLVIASCGGNNASTSESTPAATETPPAETPAPSPGLTDANIAAIVVAANNADIENGKQALKMSTNAEVKQFAQTMVTDHTAVNAKAVALVTKLGVTPEDNDVSRNLTSGQETMRSTLHDKTGADYNRSYVDNEVSYHQTVLDAIDNALIPSAQNAELKQLLTDTRPAIAAHLDHAKSIQTKLNASASQ